MPRQKTTRIRSSTRSPVLQLRVVTPKILWFETLRASAQLIKYSVIAAIILGLAYACWLFIQRSYVNNPEYQLRSVSLNPNTAMNEADLVNITQIPLNTSIFGIDVAAVEEKLCARPEIITATAKRKLPGTIEVHITERTPHAWIECQAKGYIARHRTQGHLIDTNGILYPCPPMQFDAALILPVIVAPAEDADSLIPGTHIETKAMRRALNILTVAAEATHSRLPWIDRIEPHRTWGIRVVNRDSVEAIFGIEDHDRQMKDLLLSLQHAHNRGWQIATINLIPQKNFPVTLRSTAPAPVNR